MRDIDYLLKKYSTKQKGEFWGLEAERKAERLKHLKRKIRLFDGINSEYFNLRGGQKDRAKYLIKKLNFNEMCPRCSDEQIIVMICYVVKCEYVRDYKREWCKTVFNEYNINPNRLDRFLVQLAIYKPKE